MNVQASGAAMSGTISGSVGDFLETIDQISFWESAGSKVAVAVGVFLLAGIAFRLFNHFVFEPSGRAFSKIVHAPTESLASERRRALAWCIAITCALIGALIWIATGNAFALLGGFLSVVPLWWLYFMAVYGGKLIERILFNAPSIASIVTSYFIALIGSCVLVVWIMTSVVR
jgi:hypothetical protein